MISYEDCVSFCGLTATEVQALAEHQHVPDIVAATLAQHLLSQDGGCSHIADMIAEGVSASLARGDTDHGLELKATLIQFIEIHPEAACSPGARACLETGRPCISTATLKQTHDVGPQVAET